MNLDPPGWIFVLQMAAFFLLGIGGGALYLYAAWMSVQLLAKGAYMGKAMIAMTCRFGLLALALGLVSQRGAGPLLVAASGVFVARSLILLRLKDRAV